LALDLEGGELQWYDQPNPHDVFDLDFQSPRILTTATVNGSERTIVIASGKLGRVIANDVETGERLWDTQVGEHQNDDAAGVNPGETLTVMPGTLGGVETPMALADHVVYVPVVNLASTHSPTGFDAVDGPQALENVQTNIPEGRGEFVAIDVTSGDILWTTEYETPIFSGATVINDLVFFATFDGVIHALNRESGEEVWSYQAPAQINAWPAVSGDTIVWPAGLGETPVLLALRLGAAEGEMMEGDGEEIDMEAGLDGAALVEERCTVCHSRERIDNADKTAEEWAATVDRMISNGAMLNDAERDAVIQYLAETH
ncbi:MAG: hypothetical protein EHM35_04845, partial [Planctomycetaceae bacterium]